MVRLKVNNDKGQSYTEMPELGVHSLRVMGIDVQPSTGTFISISDAGTMKVTEANSGQNVADINPAGSNTSKQALKEMVSFK